MKNIIYIILIIFLVGCGKSTSSSREDSGSGSAIGGSTNTPPKINLLDHLPKLGDAPLTVNFTAEVSDAEESNATLKYLWNFGDGTTSNIQSPKHRYLCQGSYAYSLTVTDQKDAATKAVSALKIVLAGGNRRPQITACASDKVTANAGTLINFSATATDSDSGDTLNYHWSFGDGATSTQQNPNHAYTADGIYTIQLKVFDQIGAATTRELMVGIGNNIKLPPVINNISWTPEFAPEENPINFTCQAQDYDGTIVQYLWDFGDGATSTQQNPTHTYMQADNYLVKLTVKDNEGLIVQKTAYLSIGAKE